MEVLLAAEVPLAHQWKFLEEIRDLGSAKKVMIPAARPTDEKSES